MVTHGTVVFEDRAHHMPISVLLGLFANIEAWLDNTREDWPLGVIFLAAPNAFYKIDIHEREGIAPKSVGFQSDYLDFERYVSESDMRGFIAACRRMANTDTTSDTIMLWFKENLPALLVFVNQVDFSPPEKVLN